MKANWITLCLLREKTGAINPGCPVIWRKKAPPTLWSARHRAGVSDFGYALLFLKALALTIAVETPVAWYLLSRHLSRKGKGKSTGRIAAAAVIGNMATVPYLWFFYPLIFGFRLRVAFGEATAVGVEALVYFLMTEASIGASFAASLAANAASVVVGLIVMPPF